MYYIIFFSSIFQAPENNHQQNKMAHKRNIDESKDIKFELMKKREMHSVYRLLLNSTRTHIFILEGITMIYRANMEYSVGTKYNMPRFVRKNPGIPV